MMNVVSFIFIAKLATFHDFCKTNKRQCNRFNSY